MIQSPQNPDPVRIAVDDLSTKISALSEKIEGAASLGLWEIVSGLGPLVGLLAVGVAYVQSKAWIKEFRFREEYKVARDLLRAAIGWAKSVRWARRSLRIENERAVDEHESLREDLDEMREGATEALAQLAEARVLWGPDEEGINAAKRMIQKVGLDLILAWRSLREPNLAGALAEEEARKILFDFLIGTGEDEIEKKVVAVVEAVEKVTGPILGRRGKWPLSRLTASKPRS